MQNYLNKKESRTKIVKNRKLKMNKVRMIFQSKRWSPSRRNPHFTTKCVFSGEVGMIYRVGSKIMVERPGDGS